MAANPGSKLADASKSWMESAERASFKGGRQGIQL